MKYKVGDKVKIREDLNCSDRYYMENGASDTVNIEMLKLAGKVVTIERITSYGKYTIQEDSWRWTDGLFEKRISKDKIEKVIYNAPATIVFFEGGDKVVSKAEEGDEFDWETGLAICLLKERMDKKTYNRLQPYLFEGDTPLWDTLVRMHCPHGEWEKIKKEWKR